MCMILRNIRRPTKGWDICEDLNILGYIRVLKKPRRQPRRKDGDMQDDWVYIRILKKPKKIREHTEIRKKDKAFWKYSVSRKR